MISFYWYFVEPVRTIYIYPSEIPYFIIFVAFAALISWFATIRRRAEEAAREKANLLDLTHDTVFVMDMAGAIKYWNRGAEERYGWTAEQAVGRDVHDLLKTVFPVPLEQIKAEVIRTGRWEGELVHTKKDGTQLVVASRWSLERGDQGAPLAILETNNDITERKRAEEALCRLNRELRAISNCNQTLLRATDEQSLLQEICRIVCEEAGYRMAWVGYAEHDEAKSVRPVAWSGAEEGYLASLGITWADTERGWSPTGTAIRSGKTCCIQDFATDPRLTPWRESVLQHGFLSGIALPLKDEYASAFGSLGIYSAQLNAFTPEEIRLLEELAADLAFGIVTLRSQAARGRAEQEVALLSFALNNVREAALLIDDTARFHYVNDEACRVLGYTRAELLGKSVPDIDTEFPAGRWSDHWRDLKAQRSLSFESRHRTREGGIFPVEVNANYFEYGGQAYNLALVRDISDRKRAEEALRRSEAYLADAQRLSHTGSWALDVASDKYAYCSEECLRIYGFDPQEGLPTREAVFRRIHPEDRNRVEAIFEKALREKVDSSDELRMVLPDGTVKWVHVIRHPLLNDAGDIVTVIGTSVDITERKQAEEALRESERKYQELVEHANSIILHWQRDGRIIYLNEFGQRFFGYSESEIRGRHVIGTLVPETDSSGRDLNTLMDEICANPSAFEQNVNENMRRNGERVWINWTNKVLLNSKGEVTEILSIGMDITDRKRAEEALRRSEAYLAETQGLSQTGSWALDVASWRYVYWSQQMFRIYGFDPQQGLPTREEAFRRLIRADWDRVEASSQRSLREKVDTVDEYRIVLPDGTVKDLRMTRRPVLNDAGDVVQLIGATVDITERRRDEEALRLSNAYNRSLIEASLDPLVTIGPDGKITDVNAATEAATGRSRGDLIGTDFCDYFTEPGKARAGYQQVFREGMVRDYPLELRHRDGSVTSVLYNASVYRDESGRVTGVFAAARDVTARQRAEEALRQSEAYLAEAQRLSHTGSWTLDLACDKYVYVSEEDFRIWGFDPQKGPPTGETVFRRIHPEDRNRWKGNFERALREKVDSFDEYRIVLPDGTIKHIHTIRHPVLSDAGDVVQLVGTSIDITERKHAEEALRESETRFRTFVDHAADAFFIQDFEQGTIIDVNRSASESLGYTRQELIGMTPLAFHLDSDQAEMASVAERAAAGETVIDRHWHRRKDRSLFPVEVQTSVIWHGGRQFLLKVARDISDRVRAEEQRDRLRQLEGDLAHVNRVSMLGELTASIAHEVNQPLAGVVSNGSACLRWLAGDAPNVEEAREAAGRIVRDGKRAGEVIARIRALTKRAVTPREKLDPNETIRDVLALVGDEAKRKGVMIQTQFADDLSTISGDRVQLQQVLLNLVVNAIEAMSSMDDRPRELVITTRNIDAEQVQVTVKDTGPGIDPNTLDKIFDPFYTTKPGGMGMGLSISRSILQAHGGRLWAAAKDGPGTIFHFTLPKYHGEKESNAAA
jgi:PAS domain S-box-containing protein